MPGFQFPMEKGKEETSLRNFFAVDLSKKLVFVRKVRT